jgi:hypothetical protein
MNLSFDRDLLPYEAILARFTDSALASPFRSTVPLLDGLRHGEGGWFADVMRSLGFPDTSRVALEFTVPPPRGRGWPSHTDAMVTHESRTLALEAKWTEPRYATVKKWLSGGNAPANRLEVLRGWLDLLEGFYPGKLRQEDFEGVVYQTVHRAASACAVAGQHSSDGEPEMAYLLFNLATDPGRTARTESCRDDLADFHALLGSPARLSFSVIELTMEPTAAFIALAPLEKGRPETGQVVRRALDQNAPPLFSNVEWKSIRVAGRPQR